MDTKIALGTEWYDAPEFQDGIRRAPDRGYTLDEKKTVTALKNALRYLPEELHEKAAPEFLEELRTRGRIYAYRWRPKGDLKAKPVDEYKGRCLAGKAFQVIFHSMSLYIHMNLLLTVKPAKSARTGSSIALLRNISKSLRKTRRLLSNRVILSVSSPLVPTLLALLSPTP